MAVTHIDETIDIEKFGAIVKEKNYTIIDFTADWCGPCKRMKPVLNAISEKYTQICVISINCDNSLDLARAENVRNIPCLKFYINGQLFDTLIGLRDQDDIEKVIEEMIRK